MGVTEALINAGASIANAQNSQSYSSSHNQSQSHEVSDASSWGASASHAYNYADAVSDAYSDSYGWSKAENGSQNYGYSMGGSQNYSESLSRTYGSEASALSARMAAEANAIQKQNWLDQADYNATQAQIDRDYQAYMSNTAYQRAVRDLLAAGLNPILAVGNMGASTPVGAMATSGLSASHMGTAYADSYSEGKSGGSSWNKGENQGSSWGYSNSDYGSHSESHSKSHSEGSSSSWSKEGSKSHSEGNSSSTGNSSSNSKTKTQLNDFMNGVEKIGQYVTGGSASSNVKVNDIQGTHGKPLKGSKKN